jgi:hypothetical protein
VEYLAAKPLSLKAHPVYNEKWLQQLIADDPAVLGLGDLTVRATERSQPRAGRLDLLLAEPVRGTRYEVEIQLGSTDESHIIRTIEYWDIERSRFPQYDHVAVIVAEDITSRFLNVIGLFNKAIPLIAIQLNALQVGEHLTLNATTVLDLVTRGTEEEDEPGQPVDRAYWEKRSSPTAMALVDKLLTLIQQVTDDDRLSLKLNKQYIGLARDGVANNFLGFQPRKSGHVLTTIKVPQSDELTSRLEDAGIDIAVGYRHRDRYLVRLTDSDLGRNHGVLVEMIRRASDSVPADGDEPGIAMGS